ncbi:MFS transporter [Shouchella shacheensis]|uniref:MFS transporter n=1 Tax=Shouchella shacheensis TaxID=1649580 RepID=UPI00073FECE3|nr:MFS transporter [Shouchella shacheensis]
MTAQIHKRDHVLFLASVFCFWLATYIYVPIFSLYLEHIDFPYSTIGVILGSYGVTQVLLRFPLGVLSDWLHSLRKILYVGGFAVALVSGLMLVFFDSYALVLTARLLAGVTAAMWVMATIMYAQYFTSEKSGRAMGSLQFLTVMPQFLSMAVAGILVEAFGWLFPFWIGAVVSAIGLILALFIKVVPAPEANAPKRSVAGYVKGTLQVKRLVPLTLVSLLTHSLMFMSIFGLTPNYAATMGVGEGDLIWLMVAFFLPHAAASLLVAFLTLPKHFELNVLFASFIVSAGTFFLIPTATSLTSISVLHAVIGLALGLALPLLLSQVAALPVDDLKTSVMGFYQSIYALGIFLGPLLAGQVAEWFGLEHVFTLAGLTSIVALVIVTAGLLVPARRRQTAKGGTSQGGGRAV